MVDALGSTRREDGSLTLVLNGALDLETAPRLWDRTLAEVDRPGPELVLDLSGVTTCDGAGLGLLTEADRRARAAGATSRVVGATDELAELLRLARLAPTAVELPRKPPNVVVQVGTATAALLETLRALVTFVGDLAVALPRGLVTLNGPRLMEIVRQCGRVGADAVPVVGLLGAIVGFILSVQSVKALEGIGATSLVPMVVGFATLREFGPLIAAIILAGRSGAAFAAELGTMKVTEELDAYTTFSLDPMIVLVVPRVVAGVLVTPLLALYSIVLGVLAGIIPLLGQNYTLRAYIAGVADAVVLADLGQALVKGVVFGFIVAAIGCFHGLRTGAGADAVGRSTTRAVVAGIVLVLIADSLVSSIFYSLGI